MKTFKQYINETKNNVFGSAVVDLAKKLQDSPKMYHSQSDYMKKEYWPNRKRKEQQSKQKIKEDGAAAVGSAGPTNAVSSGAIAGTGGAGGEPGVSMKKKKTPIVMPMSTRKPPQI